MTDSLGSRAADLTKLRALVRRVLDSGGRDLDAVEELRFVQGGDALGFTATTDPTIERSILHEAFDAELGEYVQGLLADDRLTSEEFLQLRSSLAASSGPMFDPLAALAPYEHLLRDARRRGG